MEGQTRSLSGPYSNPSGAGRGSTRSEGENHQARHQRVLSYDWMPRLQCNQGQQKEHMHTQIVAECEFRSDLQPLRMGQRDWTEEMK